MSELLKNLRKEEGLTQAEMAEELGVSRPTYSEIERGNKELTQSQIATVSRLFSISAEEVIRGKQNESDLAEIKVTTDKVEFNEEKLEQVLLYVLGLCGGKPNVGETVLYKILYFIDFDAYERFGKSITGMHYRHRQHGPVPRQDQFRAVVRKMKENDLLREIRQEYHGYRQKRYIALDDHDPQRFEKEEADLIEEEVNRFADMNARKIEAYVHEDQPWKETQSGEQIDYNLVFERSAPYAQLDYEAVAQDTAGGDTLDKLGEMGEEAREYYENL